MNDRVQILRLTQIAFLNALILSFLGIQFVIPFASIALLLVIPVIFALQVYHVPIKIAFISGLAIVILSFVLYGVILCIWSLTYFVLGITLGWSYRNRIPFGYRLFLVSLVFYVSILGIMIIFGRMANITWEYISDTIKNQQLLQQVPLIPIMGIGLMGWAILNSFGTDRILYRVLHQLYSA